MTSSLLSRLRGLRLWGGALFLLVGIVGLSMAENSAKSASSVYVATVADQIITPTVADYLEQSLAQAEAAEANALVIQLNTPGGLLASTQRIVSAILGAKIPVIIFVAPEGGRAASAGVFITMAGHVAAMAPATRIGAAHPVNFDGGAPGSSNDANGGDGAAKDPMSDKVMNDTIAWVQTIVATHGRNAEWAVEAVVESRSSTAKEAAELGVVDVITNSLDELLATVHGRSVTVHGMERTLDTKNATVRVVDMSWAQRILQALSDPNIAYILMMLGFYGLLFEITHPGSWIPGIAGAVCLLLAFYALDTLPTNYAGVAFIVLALLLFMAEVKVTSFGLLSLGGVACLFLGSIMLIDSSAEFMQISYGVIIPIVVVSAAISFFLASLALRAQRARVQSGVSALIGQVGTVERAIDPRGKIFVAGELWTAEAKNSMAVGSRARVIAVREGMCLEVEVID